MILLKASCFQYKDTFLTEDLFHSTVENREQEIVLEILKEKILMLQSILPIWQQQLIYRSGEHRYQGE